MFVWIAYNFAKYIYVDYITVRPISPYIKGVINCSTLNGSQENLKNEQKNYRKN